MRKWSLKMWLGMVMAAFAMFGPPINYWAQTGYVSQVGISLMIGVAVLWVLSMLVQKSWTLAFYAGLLGSILTFAVPSIEVNGLVMMAILSGAFFIVFAFVWSMIDQTKRSNRI